MSTNIVDSEEQVHQSKEPTGGGMYPPPTPQQSQQTQHYQHPSTFYKLCWVAGTISAIGLLITMLYLLSLYITAKGLSSSPSSSESFGGISQMMASLFSFIQVAQIAVNLSTVMVVADIVLLAYLLYKFPAYRKHQITYKIIGFTIVQAVYVISQSPQINGLAAIANTIKQGSLGGLLGEASTGGFNSISYISTANIILNVVCLGILIILSIVIAINLFAASIQRMPPLNIDAPAFQMQIVHTPMKLSKNAKRIIVSVICAVCVIGIIATGYFVYSNFIYKNVVDVMNGVSITYDTTQISGNSTADLTFNWPAAYKNNVEIQNFLNSASFTLNKKASITNGDKLEVQAKISQENENKYRIKLTGNLFKSVTVSGLATAVTSIDQIGQTNLKQFEADGLDAVNNNAKENIDSNTTITASFVGWYYNFGTNTSSSSGSSGYTELPALVGVYQVHSAYNSQYFQNATDSYATYELSNLIINKDKKLQTDKIKKSLNSVYVSQPDDLLIKGYTKISS